MKNTYEYFNPNPYKRSVGDCTVRALAKALNQTWEKIYVDLAIEGFRAGDLLNSDSVWGPYLRKHGFTRHLIPDDYPDCYTVGDFAEDNPKGTFILSMPGRHVVTVVDGTVFDSWESLNEVPTYYWSKEC